MFQPHLVGVESAGVAGTDLYWVVINVRFYEPYLL
jgi:hypothetical protein